MTEEPEEIQIWFGKIGIYLPKDQDSIDVARTLLDVLEKNLNGETICKSRLTPTQRSQSATGCNCFECRTKRLENSVPESHQTQTISPSGNEGPSAQVEQGIWQLQEVPRLGIGTVSLIVEKLEVTLSSDRQRLKLKRTCSASNAKVHISDMRKLKGLNNTLREAAIGTFNKGKKDVLRYALRLWDKIEVALSGQAETPQNNSLPQEDIKNSHEQGGIQGETSKPLGDSPDKKITDTNNNHGISLKMFQEDPGFNYSAVQPKWVGKLKVYHGNSNGQMVIKHSERSVTTEILRTTEEEIDRLRQYSEEDLSAVIRGIGRDKQHLLRIYLHELEENQSQ